MIARFTQTLREQLRKEVANYTGDLAGGQCKSYDEYKKLCGLIQGLGLAEQLLMALAEKVITSDE